MDELDVRMEQGLVDRDTSGEPDPLRSNRPLQQFTIYFIEVRSDPIISDTHLTLPLKWKELIRERAIPVPHRSSPSARGSASRSLDRSEPYSPA